MNYIKLLLLLTLVCDFACLINAEDVNDKIVPDNDQVGIKTIAYFENLFDAMRAIAEKDPNYSTFRKTMKPYANCIEGFYGGTLLDSNWIIRQVYNRSHFLAVGYDLKNVKELKYFIKKMEEQPSAQLSEPAAGSLMQPRLISLRFPVMENQKVKNIISIMISTDAYIKYTGLNRYKAYCIICSGKTAETKGKFTKKPNSVKIQLPSTEWVIKYQE